MSEYKPPNTIYLIPEGDGTFVWCDDPVPSPEMEVEDAIEYTRTNTKAVEALREIAASGISGGKYQSHSSLVKLAEQTLSDIEGCEGDKKPTCNHP